MNPKLAGFLRGLGYAVVFSILSYIGSNLGQSGVVSGSAAAVVTGLVGLLEHHLNAPAA